MTLNMLLILVEEMRRLEESTERVRLTIQALVLEAHDAQKSAAHTLGVRYSTSNTNTDAAC